VPVRNPEAPSGQQITLRHGDQGAIVVEVGGGLRSYSKAGVEMLDGYAEDEMCTAARGQLLIPWPNRIGSGRYHFEGRHLQLAVTEPEQDNAIHGLARFSNWKAVEGAGDRVVMALVLHPQPGYPFALDLRAAYELGDSGLSVTTTTANIGTTRCPYGVGAHPYLTLGTDLIDPLVLKAPGSRWMPTDEHQIPTGTESVDGTQYDFRTPRPIGTTVLDTGYADLERGAEGRAEVDLSLPDASRQLRLWMDATFDYLMLFTGNTLGPRARRGLGVEPMTCAPNAFNSGDGLQILEPGDVTSSSWGISAHFG
jgi:aldose 1-epimerase